MTGSASVNEAAGAISVSITRTDGSNGAISVTVTSNDGSAIAGQDYTPLEPNPTTVSFAAGDTAPKTVQVQITQDDTVEGDESLSLTLSAPTGGATLVSNATITTLTILDDDRDDAPPVRPGSVQFERSSVDVDEAADTVSVTITRTDGSDGAISVNVTSRDGAEGAVGTAIAGEDYTALEPNTTVSFAAGDTDPKTVQVRITNDKEVEADEALTLALTAPTGGATLGADTTLTILDDDAPLAAFTGRNLSGTEALFVTNAKGDAIRISQAIAVTDFAWSPDRSRIALLGRKPEPQSRRELFSVLPDGSGLVPLNGQLAQQGDVREFRWSPDSSRIAYLADEKTDELFELFSVRADGTDEPVRLNGPICCNQDVGNVKLGQSGGFEWSPDGSHIAYLADERLDEVFELFTVRPDDPIPQPIKINPGLGLGGNSGDVLEFAWSPSPDSSHIVYRANQEISNFFDLYSAHPDGVPPVVDVTGILPVNAIAGFQWSPDGSRIAFLAAGSSIDLFSARPDRLDFVKLNELLQTGRNVTEFAWSPKSSHIAYRADKDDNEVFELFSVSLDAPGTSIKLNGPLTTNGDVAHRDAGAGQFKTFEWSPDGLRIAYVADEKTNDTFELFSVSLGAPRVSVKLNADMGPNGNVDNGDFKWSPDSSRVAYVADQDTDERFELFSALVDVAGRPVQLTPEEMVDEGDVFSGHFEWLPDSSGIVYIADQASDGLLGLFLVDTNSTHTSLSSTIDPREIVTSFQLVPEPAP